MFLFPSTHFSEAFLTEEFIEVLTNIYIGLHVSCLFFCNFNKNSIWLTDLSKKCSSIVSISRKCVHIQNPDHDILSSEYLLQPTF